MKLKSYFADTVEAAMERASTELGPEAMLVYSRQAPPEARHLGRYEVVFGEGEAAPDSGAAAEKPETSSVSPIRSEPSPARLPEPEVVRLSGQIADLRAQVGRLAGSLARTNAPYLESGPYAESLGEIADQLSAAGLSYGLIRELITSLRDSERLTELSADDDPFEVIQRLLREELRKRVSVESRVGESRGGPRTVAFVGPPGVGKTSALVKVAASYALRAKRPAQILSADVYRVAAAEQLRSYAAILGIGFQAHETVGAITQALEEHRFKDLILIDTPGYGPHDREAMAELSRLFQLAPSIDVHLVLPASMKATDLRDVVDRYEAFTPAKLIFTRIDETTSPATLLTEAVRTGKDVSFVTAGQRIPEDLAEATIESLLDLAYPGVAAMEPAGDTEAIVPGPRWEEHVAGQAAAA